MGAHNDLVKLTAQEAVALLRRREVSPLELVEAALARIAATDGALNALPTLCADRARAAARELETRIARDESPGWLAGLPIAVKDLIEVAGVRQASQGQQTKMEMVYGYLTGSRFRQRVQAIVEAFSSMRDDLDREKKAITRQWAKREEQIERVMEATVGMYGDLQGIAGKSLQEIEGLEFQGMLDFKQDE